MDSLACGRVHSSKCQTNNKTLSLCAFVKKKVPRCANIPAQAIILLLCLCCIDGGNQHSADRAAVVFKWFILLVRNIAGAVQ